MKERPRTKKQQDTHVAKLFTLNKEFDGASAAVISTSTSLPHYLTSPLPHYIYLIFANVIYLLVLYHILVYLEHK